MLAVWCQVAGYQPSEHRVEVEPVFCKEEAAPWGDSAFRARLIHRRLDATTALWLSQSPLCDRHDLRYQRWRMQQWGAEGGGGGIWGAAVCGYVERRMLQIR